MARQATAAGAASKRSKAGATAASDPVKRDQILAAATRVFLASGYGGTSMDAIAEAAGVSKQTVYSHFGGKDALFGAIVRKKCGQLLEPFRMPPQTPRSPGGDPQTVLSGVAQRFLELILAAENMAHYRAVVAESRRFPELAEAFYRSGPEIVVDNLARYLKTMDREGVLAVAEPKPAARLFFAMLRGDLYIRRLLGLGPAPAQADMRRAVRQVVRVFLAAHAAGKSQRG
ncbi:MAG: TetR/AcrR family transcriptional regulator [Rhodospirillales bacterium]|nr:TetR/AcrR family transcriptional regulator [Rhodospirillales bacterium]